MGKRNGPRLVASPRDRNLLAIDIAPGDDHLSLFKRAAILRTQLLDVAVVGKDAVLAQPVLARETRRRSQAQLRQTENATFLAKDAARQRRETATACAEVLV